MGKMWYVYILSDKFPKYVGISSRPEKRFKEHLKDNKNIYKANWLKSLKNKNQLPIIEIIEICSTKKEAVELEIFYISYFKFLGCRLTNLTDGGEAGIGWGHINNKPRTCKHKNNISLALKNKPKSIEHRKKLSIIKTKERKIIGVNLTTGDKYYFSSSIQASQTLGHGNKGSNFINKVCNSNKLTAYGFKWSFL